MKSEDLFDAIGMVDDRHLVPVKKSRRISVRRKVITLVAAVFLLMQMLVTALALNEDARQIIMEVVENLFRTETYTEPSTPKFTRPQPPTEPSTTQDFTGTTESTETTDPTEPTMPTVPPIFHLSTVEIEGTVNAHYFYGERVIVIDGGFYTFAERTGDEAPSSGTFWEIRPEGIVDVGATRVDFILPYGGKEYAVVLDYAVVDGELAVKNWVRPIGELPIENGLGSWSIGGRTDVIMLTIPVDMGLFESLDYLILDLETMQITRLFEAFSMDHMWISTCWYTDDLQYAIIYADDMNIRKNGYWFLDLKQGIMTDMDELFGGIVTNPYFLDDRTIVYHEYLGEDRINIIRYDISSGEKTILLENILRRGKTGYRYVQMSFWGNGGVYGLVYYEDGSVEMMDFRTGDTLPMGEVDLSGVRIESNDGELIFIGKRQNATNSSSGYYYPEVAVLNPIAKTIMVLKRDADGTKEDISCLNNHTLVFTKISEEGGWYVYVYEFE